MERITAVVVAVLLGVLGLAGTGQAQSQPDIQVQGTIESVDCQSGTIVLNGPEGSNTVYVSDTTAVVVNSTNVQFCSLQSYVGQPAVATLVASGNQFLATQIAVTAAGVETPAPAGPAAPAGPVDAGQGNDDGAGTPIPIDGNVLGTVDVGGLAYLLVQGPDGLYYRYPYYGTYYSYYYQPFYAPYYGPYSPVLAPVIYAPAVITGLVLGTVFVGGLVYLLVNDHGYYCRYPYYGPYHHFYYNASYRPYGGRYLDAPIRTGDERWNGSRGPATGGPNSFPAHRDVPGISRPNYLPTSNGTRPSQLPRYTAPANQWTRPSQAPRYTAPANQWTRPSQAPRYTAPANQWTGPSQLPRYTPPANRYTGPSQTPRYTPPANRWTGPSQAPRYTAPSYGAPPYQYSTPRQYGPNQWNSVPRSGPTYNGPTYVPRPSAPHYSAPSRQNCGNNSQCH